MRILITGLCGFVGSELALGLQRRFPGAQLAGIDNFSRPGSETTRPRLRAAGISVRHGDVRCAGDLETAGDADWVIDAAANPSVLAGVDGRSSSRQIVPFSVSSGHAGYPGAGRIPRYFSWTNSAGLRFSSRP